MRITSLGVAREVIGSCYFFALRDKLVIVIVLSTNVSQAATAKRSDTFARVNLTVVEIRALSHVAEIADRIQVRLVDGMTRRARGRFGTLCRCGTTQRRTVDDRNFTPRPTRNDWVYPCQGLAGLRAWAYGNKERLRLALLHFSDKIIIDYYRMKVATMQNRTKHLPAEERRAVTVKAVVDLAASQNPSEITTAAIAKHMHVTQGSLFRHFPNKEAIWRAVMKWVAERLMARIDRSVQGIESPLAAMQAMFMSHIEFVAEHPGVPRMMFGELQRAEATPAKRMVEIMIQRYGVRLHALLEEGKARRELDATLDTEAAATLFIGTIQGLVMQSLLAGDVATMRRDAPGVFAIYRRGIASAR